MFENIRIILVNTSHPGNIGSAARAMKNMGLSELYLVAPMQFPHRQAQDMASNASDVVDNAIVVDTLEQAIADCHLVVGTSARDRTITWPMLMPREFAEKASTESKESKIAVVFGREQSGLTNEELHLCHYHIHIPSNPEYSSLNLAAAVQVITYELRLAFLAPATQEKWDYPYATAKEVEGFYEHLWRVLTELDFLNPPRQLIARLRRLYNRARMDVMEVNILRGVLSAIEKRIKD